MKYSKFALLISILFFFSFITRLCADSENGIKADFRNDGKLETLYSEFDGERQTEIYLIDDSTKEKVEIDLVNWEGELVSGLINKKFPPVFGYTYDGAASADFRSWKFYMWNGKRYQEIADVSSGTAYSKPLFTDLDNSGTNEIVFENKDSKYGNPPQIYRWNEKIFKFENGEKYFPDFWNKKIETDKSKLKAWQYSKKNQRDPLVYCSRIYSYLTQRGGNEGTQDFLRLADEKLQPLIDYRKNDYVSTRAIQLKDKIHKLFNKKINKH